MTYPVIPDIPGSTQSDPVTPTQKANVLAANTPPTLALDGEVVALSPANTGLPVNIPVIVQKAGGPSTGAVTSLAQAFTNANVAGNSIVVVCAAGNNGTIAVTDSAGNTYTKAIVAANSTTFEAGIFYATNIVAGANTVTVTPSASVSVGVEIYEVSGTIQQVLGALGQTSSGTGTGTTATTSNIAGPPNSLAFMGVTIGTATQNVTVTTSTNWTADGGTNGYVIGGTPSGIYQFQSLSQYLHGLRPVLPTATLAGSEPWAAVAAVFKPVVVGVEGTVTVGGYNFTNITSATTTLVKTGTGVLHAIIVNTRVASGVIEFDDALTHTTPKIGTITFPATLLSDGPIQVQYDATFATGLSITTTGTMDITVVWR